jgi:hypothetical protein
MSPLGRVISEPMGINSGEERRVDMKNKALLWLAAFVIGSSLAFSPVVQAAEKAAEKKEEKKEEKKKEEKKAKKAKKGEEKKEEKKG